MKCPIDQTELQMSERQGIEIDYCPQCRGVWLDRGELDKIIERSDSAPVVRNTEPLQQPQYRNDHHYKHKKKESFLSDIFDF